MGAWIETLYDSVFVNHFNVASYVGAWIETQDLDQDQDQDQSHPMWVRGLKLRI